MKHRKTIEQNIINFIKRLNLLSGAKKVLIGLSGGADSIFALHFFLKYKKKYKIDVAAIHVNHNLRNEESDHDEEFCKNICQKLEVELFSSIIDVKTFAKKNKYSLEEAARILRYKEYEKYCELSNSDIVITAHNNDDNTETVLLNIVNGAGIKGVSGIPPKRGKFIRPFLCVSKKDIISYLKTGEIKFVEDSSNKNLDFDRNFLRQKIVPELKENLNPSLDKVILTSSEVFRNQNKIIEFFIADLLNKVVVKNGTKLIINISELVNYPEEILGEILKKIFENYLFADYNFSQFKKLSYLIKSQVGTSQDIGKNLIAVKERNEIIIVPNYESKKTNIEVEIGKKISLGTSDFLIEEVNNLPLKFNKSGKIEYISGDKIISKLTIRNWKEGDKIQLLGMSGTKKVSDVLTDLKIPTKERKEQLVLVNNKEIIWLIGKRISEKYKITTTTKRKLKICLDLKKKMAK